MNIINLSTLESLSSIFEGGGAALLNTDHSIMKSALLLHFFLLQVVGVMLQTPMQPHKQGLLCWGMTGYYYH